MQLAAGSPSRSVRKKREPLVRAVSASASPRSRASAALMASPYHCSIRRAHRGEVDLAHRRRGVAALVGAGAQQHHDHALRGPARRRETVHERVAAGVDLELAVAQPGGRLQPLGLGDQLLGGGLGRVLDDQQVEIPLGGMRRREERTPCANGSARLVLRANHARRCARRRASSVVLVAATRATNDDLVLLDGDLDRPVARPVLGVGRVVLDGGVEPQPVALLAVVEGALERARGVLAAAGAATAAGALAGRGLLLVAVVLGGLGVLVGGALGGLLGELRPPRRGARPRPRARRRWRRRPPRGGRPPRTPRSRPRRLRARSRA